MKSVLSRGDLAETHFKTLKKLQNCSWLECLPITGRTHQIRVHLSELGHPILGDSLYGGNDSRVPRLMLHAQGLEFPHPIDKKQLFIEAEAPSDFSKILKNVSI
jgi:23S rRNA pseudouridine1911/1915/1917 synthase